MIVMMKGAKGSHEFSYLERYTETRYSGDTTVVSSFRFRSQGSGSLIFSRIINTEHWNTGPRKVLEALMGFREDMIMLKEVDD